MSHLDQKERLRKYTLFNLGIGILIPMAIWIISGISPRFFHIQMVIWVFFGAAVYVIIWMLLNLARASNSKFIRLPGLILWGIACPLCSIFLFAGIYFGHVNKSSDLSFGHALEFSFSAFIRKDSIYSGVCDCKFFEISQNYLGYVLLAYVIAVTIQGINYRIKEN